MLISFLVTTPLARSSQQSRIIGLDIARGLAIIGMITAHIGPFGFLGAKNPTDGYPSALFAVLAGVSMSIMASGGLKRGGKAISISRKQLILRGILLTVLAICLGLVQQSVAVVLFEISLTFMLLWWMPAVRTRWQITTVALLLLGSSVMALLSFPEQPYPLIGWVAYGAVGALLHRTFIHTQPRIHLGVGLIGIAVAALGLWVRVGDEDPATKTHLWLASTAPHSGGVFDLFFSLGAALGILGLSLYISHNPRVLLRPLQATGSMALTAYLVHILSAGPLLDHEVAQYNKEQEQLYHAGAPQVPGKTDAELYSHPLLWVGTIGGLLVFAPLWKQRFRRGPAEWAMYRSIEAIVPRSPKE